MSKIDFHHDSDDDDIWDYQPRQRNRFSQISKQKQGLTEPSQLKSNLFLTCVRISFSVSGWSKKFVIQQIICC